MEPNENEDDLNIARRTRSHLQMNDFIPSDNLDFPDVDINLYQDPELEVDAEYKNFLLQTYSKEIVTDINTDTNTDENDPNYEYNDDIFSHGWRFDINEVNNYSGELANLTTLQAETSQQPSPIKNKQRRLSVQDPETVKILNRQLEQHIQLLTQTYLLTKNTTNMKNKADEAKSHLMKYEQVFENKQSKPSNLLPAINLVNNLPVPKDIKSSIRLSWRPLLVPDVVKATLADNPNIFLYSSLLPLVAFSKLPEKLIPKKSKINFTINEDNLLAYALNLFKGEPSQYTLIEKLLMTAKTKTQISNHIKNIKRSPGNENNPIKLYFLHHQLPDIDLNSDSQLVEINKKDTKPIVETVTEESVTEKSPIKELPLDESKNIDEIQDKVYFNENNNKKVKLEQVYREDNIMAPVILSNDMNEEHEQEHDIMNMDLDDLMAASTTISKSTVLNVHSTSENSKNVRNQKLKKSMLNLMSHKFLLSQNMGDLMIYEFLKSSQKKLSERNYLHLLQLLSDLMRRETKKDDEQTIVRIYQEISKFLKKINAPNELNERLVLFLDLEQASKLDCAFSYLHWMRFFEFMQHVELYHDGDDAFEKKLVRLIDALQKDDPHKIKLAIANLVNKHPFLKRQFESLSLDEKPHPSLFICHEDFDDITDPMSMFYDVEDKCELYKYEHFNSKVSKEELNYASPTCSCNCHSQPKQTTTTPNTINTVNNEITLSQHCNRCNLKFMKGRMYLVNRIKPILAEWSFTGRTDFKVSSGSSKADNLTSPSKISNQNNNNNIASQPTQIEWTFEEDREILEFCRSKALQNEETVSFDVSTFEELVNSHSQKSSDTSDCRQKNAQEIAERFNQLMEMYRDENSNAVQ